MKTIFNVSLLILLLLSACAPATPSPTQQPVAPEGDYPLDTRTGIPDVDRVLAAVASGDPEQLRSVVVFTSAPCTNAEGLGGPPKCREGEEEGTVVNVLPMLSSEGHFIRKDEIDTWQGIDVVALYAVYRVSDDALKEDFFPAGEYMAFFVPPEGEPGVALRIAEGGIVRVDSQFDLFPESLDAVIERDTSEVILAPISR